MEAGRRVKEEGAENDLLERIAADPDFPVDEAQLRIMMDPIGFVGCSVQQTEEYLEQAVKPLLDKNPHIMGIKAEINV